MKKYKSFLILLIIIMIIPFIMKILKKEHKVKYENNKYEVSERFIIKENKHYYEFEITKKNEKYTYILNEKLNKRKEIIKDIKEYKEGNIKCILPIYKKKIDNELYCIENSNQVSNYYLKDNEDYNKILSKVKKYKINKLTTSKKKTKYENMIIYQENILDDYAYLIWNYKGIYIIKNNDIKYQEFLKYDLYDNIMNALTSRYYVLFENTSVNGIENIHCYDLIKDKYKTIKLEEKIDKDSYINGVYNDKIYVTDKKNKIQYRIDVKKEKIEEIGNEALGYIKDPSNEKDVLNKSDFFLEEVYFNSMYIEEENYSEVIEKNDKYYFRTDSSFYERISNNNILLFNIDNIKEWQVYDKDILVLKDNEVYLYNNENGLNKIIEYNELNYNYENIIKLWK